MTTSFRRFALGALVLVSLLGSLLAAVPARAQSTNIVAVVNGDVISQGDVAARARLFALSAGISASGDIVARLRPQVVRQLVDEKLRLQEIQRRHIVITDKQIADAIREVESRNNLPAGALRAKLESDGVSFRTLIDQIRVQLGWLQVLRQTLADQSPVTPADVEAQKAMDAAETGKPEFRVSEIFLPIENPAQAAEAQRFADTIITQLRGGAPFAVMAAQFSQSQTALQGGDRGWVQPNELDPRVAPVVTEMPVGAISNPLQVPGGLEIVQLRAKREIGKSEDTGPQLNIRQVFLPFGAPLNPAAPTEQQKATLEKAKSLSASIHSCEQMEAANKANNSPRPADPGPVNLNAVTPPAFRQLLATLPDGQASKPLVAPDGIAVIIVCGRGAAQPATETADQIRERLVSERIEQTSRQLLRDLQRKAIIDIRNQPPAALPGKS